MTLMPALAYPERCARFRTAQSADLYEHDFFHAPQGSAEYQRSLFELALLETKLRSDMYMNSADIKKCYTAHVGPS